MNKLLREFISYILEAAPKKPSPVPAGLFAGSFGNYYKDQALTQYAGKVSGGKWIPASAPEKPAGAGKSTPEEPSKPAQKPSGLSQRISQATSTLGKLAKGFRQKILD